MIDGGDLKAVGKVISFARLLIKFAERSRIGRTLIDGGWSTLISRHGDSTFGNWMEIRNLK
jgi:hypothetical protein